MLVSPRALFPDGAGTPARQLIDARAPIEVARGALPFAHALPLMTDEERRQVGIRYKEGGPDAAVALGYELVGPDLERRTEAWRTVANRGPTAVTCWRGGMRSKLVVEFIGRDDVARVDGGYKALRADLLERLPRALARKRLVVLTGLTGSGKTRLLRALPASGDLQVLDLEGEARHRGSAFGAIDEPQPSQQTFENAVAAQVILSPAQRLVVEDESRYVGRRTLPGPLLAAMRAAPVVVLEASLAARVSYSYREYVQDATRRHGVAPTAERLLADTGRLRRRLGGQRTDEVLTRIAALAADEEAWHDPEAHTGWITTLLEEYYDVLYRKALAKHGRPVAFRGDEEDVRAWLTRTERGAP